MKNQCTLAGSCLLASFFLTLCPFSPVDLTEAQEQQPPVEVTVYLTAEKKACAPDGYSDKFHARTSKCAPLIYEKLDAYEFGHPIYAKVPPECLPLGDLAEHIKRATQDCPIEKYCEDPERRKAIVLVFDFGKANARGRKVKFIRDIPKRLEKHFEMDPYKGTYVAKGTLDQGGHWINHQRADLFLPDYDVTWTLDVDNHIFKLGTREGIKNEATGEWTCDDNN